MAVEVYVRKADPYSVRLQELLRRKGVDFVVKDSSEADDDWKIPQLVVDGEPIGTYEDVGSLDLKGELDELLKRNS